MASNGPTAGEDRLCTVCSKETGKYKCAKCTIPFCSVPCSKEHQAQCIPLPKPPPPRDPIPPPEPRSRRTNPFTALDSSPELSLLFERYPNLPSLLLNIDKAMQPPTFSERVVAQAATASAQASGRGGGIKNENWTHDLSLRKGKEALNRARNLNGKDGEAVREYQALVLKLVGKQHQQQQHIGTGGGAVPGDIGGYGGHGQFTNGGGAKDGEEEEENLGPDVADLLRQQLEREDERLIKDLLRAEKAVLS